MTRTLPNSLFLLALAACSGDKRTDDNPTPPTTVVEGCTIDTECDSDEICEAGECEVGDRDNSFDDAQTIRLNESVEGVIQPPGDIDHFVYESLGPEWIRVQTTNSGDPNGSLDTVVQVFAENGAEHARADNFATGRVNTYDSVAIFYLPRAGTWYITVEDVSTHYEDAFDEPRGDEDFYYTIEMIEFGNRTLETDSPTLPNNTIELPGGSTIVSYGINLEEPGDSDWLVIDPPFAGQPLEVWGVPVPGSDARPVVNLYRREDEALVASKENLGTDGICSYFGTEDVLYTLEATDLSGGGGDDYWFVVFIRTWEEGANHPVFGDSTWEIEVEPNEDAATAMLPTVNTEVNQSGASFDVSFVQGTFEVGEDVDTFEITVEDDEGISVRCWDTAYGSQADIRATLLDVDGSDVTPADQGLESTSAGYFIHNALVGAGTFNVQLHAEDAFGGPSAYYRCAIYQTDFEVAVGDLP